MKSNLIVIGTRRLSSDYYPVARGVFNTCDKTLAKKSLHLCSEGPTASAASQWTSPVSRIFQHPTELHIRSLSPHPRDDVSISAQQIELVRVGDIGDDLSERG